MFTFFLFVNFDGAPQAVSSLAMANDGYLVATPKADVCPNCGHEGYIPGRFCPWCNFPDDAKVCQRKHVSMD